ncbi:Uncharacterized protein APZ42_003343, partial [Daphnia magna]
HQICYVTEKNDTLTHERDEGSHERSKTSGTFLMKNKRGGGER